VWFRHPERSRPWLAIYGNSRTYAGTNREGRGTGREEGHHAGRAARRPRDCDLAIALCAGGRLDLAPLVTARFSLTRAADAFQAAREPGQLKVIIDAA
jgi:threonine dehydrogenase-like Zn-dependent dehydrogenase